jgi:TPR repeat protein
MSEKIFISYKRIDKKKVLPIVEEIKKKTGVNCWIDLEGIESGDQFERVIIRAIKECEILVFMMTRNSIAPYIDPKTGQPDYDKPSWTEKEVKYALEQKKRVIPISVDGTMVSDCDWLAFNFLGTDCIMYNNKEQKDKLFRNITKWLKKKEDTKVKPSPKVEVKQDPIPEVKHSTNVEAKTSSQPASLPAKPASPSSKPSFTYMAIAAAIVLLIAALAFGLWPKNATVEPTTAESVAIDDSASSIASNQPLTEAKETPQPNVGKGKNVKSNQPQPTTSSKPTSSQPSTTEQPPQSEPVEEILPTIQGAPLDLDSIGACYLFGKGVKKDPKQAVIYFQSAAKQGLASAQTHLGSCYYSGTGVKQNHQQAFEWFKKAAAQGDVTAQDNLGSCYLLGHGTSKNHTAAVEWYQKAADKGNANAQAHLGSCYLYGQGVTVDKNKAIYWYEKAAAQGNTTAKRNLEKLKAN